MQCVHFVKNLEKYKQYILLLIPIPYDKHS